MLGRTCDVWKLSKMLRLDRFMSKDFIDFFADLCVRLRVIQKMAYLTSLLNNRIPARITETSLTTNDNNPEVVSWPAIKNVTRLEQIFSSDMVRLVTGSRAVNMSWRRSSWSTTIFCLRFWMTGREVNVSFRHIQCGGKYTHFRWLNQA